MKNYAAMIFSACICIFVSCTHEKPDESAPKPSEPYTYDQAAERLMPLLDRGWVVTRGAGGEALDLGDSLLFTGLAMGALDCARGAVPEAALVAMLRERNGGVYRHPSIPDDYSLDGLLGLWWGIAHRAARCPEAKELWASLLPQHKAAISVQPFFGVALQAVMANLGVSGGPSLSDRGQLGAEVAGWAVLVVAKREAAFRLHLGFLTLDLVDAPKAKDNFCSTVTPAKIPLLEHFCGRSGLSAWYDGFAFNRYLYAFQRAAWEHQDDTTGKVTPAIDLLVAAEMLYPDGAIPSKI